MSVTKVVALNGVDAADYRPHPLHSVDRTWVEKNCYVDIWIEVVHALGLEPLAFLPFAAFIDFEGDQWSFFKPSHDELRELYGIHVQELNVWRPLIEHALEHLGEGKPISTEADAYWLPDTAGTDYRRQHTKSTIVLNEVDIEARVLGYFHNAGYFRLEGEDFLHTFRLDQSHEPSAMPLFAEIVRIDGLVHRSEQELIALSRDLWKRHLRYVPAGNPVDRFRVRFEQDLADIRKNGIAYYHAWAFATTRQLGAAFEAAALNLKWLQATDVKALGSAIEAFELISAVSKTFILKGARIAAGRHDFDRSMFDQMAGAWRKGMDTLRAWAGV